MSKKGSDLVRKWFEEDAGLFVGGMNVGEIQQMAKNIGVVFSSSYVDFLKNYGSGIVDSFYIHGNPCELFMGGPLKSVADKTLFYKTTQKWPGIDDWYVISDDGRGNPIGCKPDGSVWLSDHDAGFEQIKLADSFEDFLHKLLTDTLYQ